MTAGVVFTTPAYLLSPPSSAQVLQVYDRHGLKVLSYAPGEGYDWVPFTEIPAELSQMLILAEDKNFNRHHGIDFISGLRSLFINVEQGEIKTGASTITQQVYRLHHKIPRTFFGKFRTMLGALLIETQYSKQEILGHYLNAIPYGKRIVGIRRASEVYFGKPLKELSVAEMAVMSVIPRAPSFLLKEENRPLLLSKRDALLKRFGEVYRTSDDVMAYELKTGISLYEDKSGWDNFHFVQRILQQPELPKFIAKGRIDTTIDLWLQKKVSEIARNQLKKLRQNNANHSAVLVLDNQSGDILSYLGSTQIDAENGSHYDGLTAKRQPGSALKPFTYALALQNGGSLTDVLPDIPSYYKTGAGQYLPRNYSRDFTGPRLMREALANSLNLPAVYLADYVGVTQLHRFLSDLGFSLPEPPHHYGVGLTLGNAEISPMELARSYTAFINGNEIIEPKYFLHERTRKRPAPINSETAFQIKDVLADPVARKESFGEGNVFELPFEFAVKTGTSTDFRDNWAVGFNSSYTVLVWVGNMNQAPMKKVSGISGAGPIVSEVMKVLMNNKYVPGQRMPSQLQRVPVCSLSGKRPGIHCPHRKFEIVSEKKRPSEDCDYHREVNVRGCHEPDDERKVIATIYPDEYQSFLQEKPEWSLKNQISLSCPNKDSQIVYDLSQMRNKIVIKRPLPGSIFAIDPNIPSSLQNLSIQLNRSLDVKKVSWKLNETMIPENGPELDWPMKKGQHEISAEVELNDGSKHLTEAVRITIL